MYGTPLFSSDLPSPVGGVGALIGVDGTREKASTPTLLVVDDHELLRLGIREALHTRSQVRFDVFEAANLADALDVYARLQAVSLVLLDLNMPDCRGLSALKAFRGRFPDARILVISGTQDDVVVAQVRGLGAIGYVLKAEGPSRLVDLVVGLWEATQPADPTRPRPVLQRFPGTSRLDRVAELGDRHLEILDLVLYGCSNQEIAQATGLSLGTVKNYVSTILLALDVKSRSHLVSLFR
jgi:DNA-binding NarL/FixJ family response regulator